MIMSGEEQYHRRGHFERIFPIPEGRTYLKYYPQRRNETIYYVEWLEKKYGVIPDPGIVSFTCRLDDDDADEDVEKKDEEGKKEQPSLIDFIQKRRKELKTRKSKKIELEENDIVIVEKKDERKSSSK